MKRLDNLAAHIAAMVDEAIKLPRNRRGLKQRPHRPLSDFEETCIVWKAADGMSANAIAHDLGRHHNTVLKFMRQPQTQLRIARWRLIDNPPVPGDDPRFMDLRQNSKLAP